MKRWGPIAALIVVAIVGWLIFDWYRAKETAMSETPPRTASAAVLEARDSVVLANLSVGYPVIASALNAAADRFAKSEGGSEEIRCVSNDFPKFRECLTVNWSVHYGLNGPITVARDGARIRVTVPAQFNGQAGFGGTIARLVGLHAKNFDGAFTVSASAGLSLDERFCPVIVPGDVAFGWQNEGRVELVGRSGFSIFGIGFSVGPWNLDIGRHFNGPIRAALASALADAGRAIPCDSLRVELQKIWRNHSLPVTLENAPPLFVNIEPKALGTSGLIAEDAGVRLAARMAARALVTTAKGSEEAGLPLPAHETVAAEQGRLQLAVPLKVPYAVLQAEAAKAFADKPITIRTEAGDVVVTVEGAEIYPSGDKVAVGVRFAADLPWRLFDARGMIWVTARPVTGQEGKLIQLQDVAVTRQIDNPLWSVVTASLKDEIDALVGDAAVHDLSPQADKLAAAIKAAVTDPARTGGVRFDVGEIDLGLGRIVAEENDLAVEGLLDAEWSASLENIGL